MRAHTQDGRPTESELIAVVSKQADGMSALDLLKHFTNEERYPAHDVQRAIQRALNANSLELGPKLKLYVTREMAAA